MAGKILLIHHGTAFLTSALINSLKNAGILAELVEPDLDDVLKWEEGADVFLYFAEGDDYLPADLLLWLKEECATGKRHFCVLGYTKEVAEVEEIVSKDAIKCTFLRPIDVKTITEQLCTLYRAQEKRKRRKSILLVDDDATFLRIMEIWLSKKYDVTAVKSGTQAIAFLTSHTPDLILLDYDMPVTSGPQVLKIIRNEPKSASIPVIFLTGKNDRRSVMSVMSLKPDGYLLKLSGKEPILATVDDFIAKTYEE